MNERQVKVEAFGASVTAFHADRAEGIVNRFDVGPYTGAHYPEAEDLLVQHTGISRADARRLLTTAIVALHHLHPLPTAAEKSAPCGS